jgi:hypothetical protein
MEQSYPKKSLTFFFELEKIIQIFSGEEYPLIKRVQQDGGEISHLEAWSLG